MTYNTKAGRHDDIVSAAAVAAWRLSDGAVGWGPPSAELAAMVLGLGGSHAGAECWPKSGPANAAFGSFFTLSKRKGTPASFRLKTARSTISR